MASSHCTEREGTGSEGGAANDQVKAKKKIMAAQTYRIQNWQRALPLSHTLRHTHTHTLDTKHPLFSNQKHTQDDMMLI